MALEHNFPVGTRLKLSNSLRPLDEVVVRARDSSDPSDAIAVRLPKSGAPSYVYPDEVSSVLPPKSAANDTAAYNIALADFAIQWDRTIVFTYNGKKRVVKPLRTYEQAGKSFIGGNVAPDEYRSFNAAKIEHEISVL